VAARPQSNSTLWRDRQKKKGTGSLRFPCVAKDRASVDAQPLAITASAVSLATVPLGAADGPTGDIQ
jgi:hypothetical protein